MRIIAWNANYNNRRRSFEADAEFLYSEGADLIVLSETARPVAKEPDRIAWVGRNGPGLGVIARNGYTISANDRNSSAPALFGAFHVWGPFSLNLLAAWEARSDHFSIVIDLAARRGTRHEQTQDCSSQRRLHFEFPAVGIQRA